MRKFLGLDAGRIKEFLGIKSSAGAADADKLISTNDAGKLDETFLPTGVGAEVVALEASEALGAGDLVNIFDDAGTIKARLADANSPSKACDGFTKASVSLGNTATVYRNGANDQVSGLTPGVRHYLSASTPGAATDTPVTGSGKIHQFVGKTSSATELAVEPDDPITLA